MGIGWSRRDGILSWWSAARGRLVSRDMGGIDHVLCTSHGSHDYISRKDPSIVRQSPHRRKHHPHIRHGNSVKTLLIGVLNLFVFDDIFNMCIKTLLQP